ncbi:MAG: tetratricopeptide repeat-containing serine/threonine-protein kinase [Chloroflexi bacterium]|nr:tetratricopeptide repeat-containing serine/threonine-protein kinase [Chloroflexota bacterium]
MNTYPSGSKIFGRYEVAGNPLIGGMGIVYICNDLQADRSVALKTFKPEYLPERAARDLFLRECTAWVELGQHPNIVRCYQIDNIELETFLVLELVSKEHGHKTASLTDWIHPGSPLSVDQALLFALQIARGMKHAGEIIPGFVHRDLKPDNILVGADTLLGTNTNRVRVTDFGLARTVENRPILAFQQSKTSDGKIYPGRTQSNNNIVGTPLYMAPEQWLNENVGVFTDGYALGCILFEMLTGRSVIDMIGMNSVDEIKNVHCLGKLSSLPESIHPEVNNLYRKLTAFDPLQRYDDWKSVEDNLSKVYFNLSGKTVPSSDEMEETSFNEKIPIGWSYNAIGTSYLDIGKTEVAVGYFKKIPALETGNKKLESAALNSLGIAYDKQGKARLAYKCFEQVINIAREIEDRGLEENALANMGIACLALGKAHQAIEFHELHLVYSREIDDRQGVGYGLANLGNAYQALGDAQRAINYYEQSLAISREIDDIQQETIALGSLGVAYDNLGDTNKAIDYLEQSLAISRETGNREAEGSAIGNIGTVIHHQGDSERAIECHNQHFAISRETGDKRGESTALGNLGIVYDSVGNTQLAIRFYEQALSINREIDFRRGISSSLEHLGLSYNDVGNNQLALECYTQALAILKELGNQSNESKVLREIGATYAGLGYQQQAIKYYEQSLAIARAIRDERGEANTLTNLGVSYHLLNNAEQAIKCYEQELAIRQELGDLNGYAKVLGKIALHYSQQGEIAQALRLAKETVRIFTQLGNLENVQLFQKLVANLQNDEPKAAFDAFQSATTFHAMQAVVDQHRLFHNSQFVQSIRNFVMNRVRPVDKQAVEQKLSWLLRIVGS